MSGRRSRRDVLRLTGASMAAATTTQVASAESVHRGVSYDTLTHKTSGRVSSQVKETQDGFEGSIRVAGFNIPLDELKKSSSESSYTSVYNSAKHTRDGNPLKLKFYEERDGQYSGYITRPSPEYGKLAFFLTSDPSFSAETALKNFSPDKKWTDQFSFTIPSNGIPTDTSVLEMKKKLPEKSMQNGGDA
jgi:hypothetical protein